MLLASFLQTVVVPVVGQTRLITVALILVPVVYIVVLLLRTALPGISGAWAILLNFAISTGAFLLALPQASWFTMTTLTALALSVTGAAGVHGTVKSLSAPAPVPAEPAVAQQFLDRKGVQRPDLP